MFSLAATLRDVVSTVTRWRRRTRGYLALACALLLVMGMGSGGRHTYAQEPDADTASPQQGEHQVYLPALIRQPPLTSFELIERALERGEIEEETALTYKVFAAFGDDRLPDRYRGDDEEILETNVGAEVMAQWDDLSQETQETIGPFMVQPIYEGSWWHLRQTQVAPQNTNDEEVPPCLPRQKCDINTEDWGYVGGEHVKVWYPKDSSDEMKPRAEFARDAVEETIWPTLTEYMGREPLPDDEFPETDIPIVGNGGDARLDIAVLPFHTVQTRNFAGVLGEVWPYLGCGNTPTFMLVNGSFGGGEMKSVLAHELMHSIQGAYNVQASCKDYDWWAEASATWAEHYVYDQLDEYQDKASNYLKRPDRPLNYTNWNAEYGAYLWPFYLHETNPNQDLIRKIWENAEAYGSLEATERALAGAGIDRAPDDKVLDEWQPFTLLNWNWEPVDVYQEWDGLLTGARALAHTVSLDGEQDTEYVLLQEDRRNGLQDEKLLPLSSAYYHFTEFGDDARSVLFANGFSYTLHKEMVHFGSAVPGVQLDVQGELFTYGPQGNGNEDAQEGAGVWMLAKIGGEWQSPQDVTNDPGMTWCRDLAEERIEELVLIFSNGRRDEALSPPKLAPRLWVSNVGCGNWTLQEPIEPDLPVTDQFEGDEDTTIVEATDKQTMDNIVFERLSQGPRSGGLVANPIYEYALTQGALSFAVSGEVRVTSDDSDGEIVCTVDDSGSSPLFTGVEDDGFRPNRLVTMNYVLGGDAYRSYLMHIFETENELSFTEVCTDTGTDDEWTEEWLYQVAGLAQPGDEISEIRFSEDGTVIEGQTDWVGNYYTDPGPGDWRFEVQPVE